MSQTEPVPAQTASTTVRRIALAAMLIAAGNIASRVLGLVRESVIGAHFGLGVDTFTAASIVPTQLYDLLINGAISAALVPVLSEYAEGDEREFWHVASTVINLALLVLAALAAVLALLAGPVVTVVGGGFAGPARAEAMAMVRWLMPAVVLMGLSGLITALLYARQKFLLPAFTTSAYNLGIIAAAALLATRFGPFALVFGVLLGAGLQVLLQLPGLRGMAYRPTIDLRHPGVRRILKLYAPVALGITFSTIGVTIDRNLASQFGGAISAMRYATTLIQFPLGLVAAAISFAVLPILSRQASAGDKQAFGATLGMGLKVVLLLVLPATFALAALRGPIVAAIFQRHQFGSQDAAMTAQALLLYLPGLPAAALDQVLLFAVYAHKRTLMPNLVQGGAVLIYLATALGLLATTQLGFGALVLGNSAQWVGHLLILLYCSRELIVLRGLRLGEAFVKCGAASVALGLAAWGASSLVSAPLAQLALGGAAGAAVYLALCAALRVEALDFFLGALMRKLRRR
ncbi:murein biosynthesis integral membrane protein MurJ [Chloroflexia bacterium SDU3-3]|nr:murein biosynthesis integral membrane protein MurJ [Chloroflexia bacterium SDU3-3]